MGTDIHGVFQRRDGSRWLDVQTLDGWYRHYKLFDELEAIEPRRGLPDDFLMRNDMFHASTGCPEPKEPIAPGQRAADRDVLMGFPECQYWLMGEEVLAWEASKFGIYVLNRVEYEEWHDYITDPFNCITDPDSYRKEIGHDAVTEVPEDGTVIVDEGDLEALQCEDWTHVRCRFRRELYDELAYFFDEVARLVALHGRIRLVFGFSY